MLRQWRLPTVFALVVALEACGAGLVLNVHLDDVAPNSCSVMNGTPKTYEEGKWLRQLFPPFSETVATFEVVCEDQPQEGEP